MTATPRRWGRLALQLLGVLISLALLAWCIHTATRPESLENLRLLAHAGPATITGLLALSLLSLLLNGSLFWATLRPIRALRFWDVQATNAVATFLAYFPFKLSIVWRVLVHHRRDHIPVLTIGAWLAANAAVMLGVLAPLALAGFWRQGVDPLYFAAALTGLALTASTIYLLARTFGGPAGLERLRRLAPPVPLASKILSSRAFLQLHAGLTMLADARTLALAYALRLADVLTQAARFALAAHATGQHLPAEKAVLIAGVYFLIGVLSPTGAVGAREGGTTGFTRLLPGIDHRAFSVIALAVSAAEMIIVSAATLLALAWLRPWRLLDARPPAPSIH